MRKTLFIILALALLPGVSAVAKTDTFPDGKAIPEWFNDTSRVSVDRLGPKYVLTDYGVKADSALLQTEAIQRVIDLAAERGGGVVTVPRGTFLSGALFFRQGTHLLLEEGAVLKGVDAIKHYPIMKTRMEGQTLDYFAALVNADGLDGFTITGPGTINGNVLNAGLIPNLPEGCCVEVPCLVDRNGVQPTYVGKLPEQLAAYNRMNIGPQMLTVAAVLEQLG